MGRADEISRACRSITSGSLQWYSKAAQRTYTTPAGLPSTLVQATCRAGPAVGQQRLHPVCSKTAASADSGCGPVAGLGQYDSSSQTEQIRCTSVCLLSPHCLLMVCVSCSRSSSRNQQESVSGAAPGTISDQQPAYRAPDAFLASYCAGVSALMDSACIVLALSSACASACNMRCLSSSGIPSNLDETTSSSSFSPPQLPPVSTHVACTTGASESAALTASSTRSASAIVDNSKHACSEQRGRLADRSSKMLTNARWLAPQFLQDA